MADIVKKTANYRIKQIEIAEAQYYQTLIKTLQKCETLKQCWFIKLR